MLAAKQTAKEVDPDVAWVIRRMSEDPTLAKRIKKNIQKDPSKLIFSKISMEQIHQGNESKKNKTQRIEMIQIEFLSCAISRKN